jgi:D-beta-D-heptose 7-phosphate kinase/D-beta-D-heptose 1-phosphate adenosyltransferase
VLIFDEQTPHVVLRRLRPDVLVKGGTTTDVVGREVVEAYGGTVCTTDIVGASSTTKIVASIRQANESCERNRTVHA